MKKKALQKLAKAALDEQGHEIVSSIPLEVPLKYLKEPSMIEHMRRVVREELSRQAVDEGYESFVEADDFVVDDDPEPINQYDVEEDFEPQLPLEPDGGVSAGDKVVSGAAQPPAEPDPKGPLTPPPAPAKNGDPGSSG